MSGDPEQEYFADGMVEDIITALSRKKGLFVIARNSSFFYKGKQFDIRQVGRELGVRYVLEGSVRKAGNRVRITGQLIDATNGSHIWAHRFEGLLEDIFDLQDRITVSVVGAIAPQVEFAEIERAKQKPVENLGAYDVYLRGLAAVWQNTREGTLEARRLLLKAIEMQPTLAIAWAQLAMLYTRIVISGLSSDFDSDSREGVRYGKHALSLDRSDPRVLSAAGYVMGRLGGEPEEGLILVEQATELDPNFANAWARSGSLKGILGDYDAAIERATLSLRLSPRDMLRHIAMSTMSQAWFFNRDYAKAIDCAEDVMRTQPYDNMMLPVRAASLALSGMSNEARQATEQFLQRYPGMTVAQAVRLSPHRTPEYRDRLADGLRRAGLPE